MNRLLFGFIAIILAISANAFKNTQKKQLNDIYVQISPGNYELYTGPYDSNNCLNVNNNYCSYIVTATGASHVTGLNFSNSTAITYISLGYIKPITKSTGIYEP